MFKKPFAVFTLSKVIFWLTVAFKNLLGPMAVLLTDTVDRSQSALDSEVSWFQVTYDTHV